VPKGQADFTVSNGRATRLFDSLFIRLSAVHSLCYLTFSYFDHSAHPSLFNAEDSRAWVCDRNGSL
jgi:hypothetical protein